MARKYIDADRLNAEIERHIKDVKDAGKILTPNMGFFDAKLSGIYDVMSIVASLQQEQPEDIVVTAKTFLDALSKTPYNNKPITDAQIIVRQLLLFLENPKEYNPDAILEQPVEGLEEEIERYCGPYNKCPVPDFIETVARHFAEWGAEHLKR